MDEYPRTQPDGSLTPPPRVPPTALATAAPLPPPQPSRPTRRWELQAIVDRVFDRGRHCECCRLALIACITHDRECRHAPFCAYERSASLYRRRTRSRRGVNRPFLGATSSSRCLRRR